MIGFVPKNNDEMAKGTPIKICDVVLQLLTTYILYLPYIDQISIQKY